MPCVRFHPAIDEIPAPAWDALAGDQPSLSHAYLSALETSGCVSPRTGWTPRHAALWEGDTLLAACPDGAGAGSIFYSIHRSADDGATWTAVRGDPVQLVNAGGVSFAATDADHLVATSGGSADVHGSLKVTADGGATWSAVTDPAVPDTGWGWVGAPGPNWFYLVAVDSARGYYWSHDKGATWTWTEMS